MKLQSLPKLLGTPTYFANFLLFSYISRVSNRQTPTPPPPPKPMQFITAMVEKGLPQNYVLTLL